MSLKPLIAICGTTGVGKSRLAVELALAAPHGGRIINADAMQVYEGLDVLTNKIPPAEQRGIDHLLMSFKKPGEQYVVGDWVKDAMREIDSTHAKGKIPVVVGGTSYWIHHLLFPNTLPGASSSSNPSVSPSSRLLHAMETLPESLLSLYDKLPSTSPSAKTDPDQAFALHSLLSQLDPAMASRWHWKDTRKVLRNLEIIKENGRLASEVVTNAHTTGVVGRYKTLIFWLYAEPSKLRARLDGRVDEMISQGLLNEIRSIKYSASEGELDFTLGVYQAIGYKELHKYAGDCETDHTTFATAVAEMKHNTRKYAQRQIKWIRNKLLPAVQACNTNTQRDQGTSTVLVYLLDATEVTSGWEANVLNNAREITEAFLSNSATPDPLTLSAAAREFLSAPSRPTHPTEVMHSRRKTICPVCTIHAERPVMLEEGQEWEAHQRTRAHRRIAAKNELLGKTR
ncbi:hypothetical protein M0805_003855 [Coniferiporia weirii]|nr:hypothetical protein M0805_003855 [Coniferiporia weirii]